MENAQKQEFGTKNLIAMLEAQDSLTMDELNKTIITAIDAHRGKEPYVDDIALFSCRFF